MNRLIYILESIRPNEDYLSSNDFIVDGQLDSFDIMMLINALEETFSIRIENKDITPENIRNVQAIASLLGKYGVTDFGEPLEVPTNDFETNTTLSQDLACEELKLTPRVANVKQDIVKTLKNAGIQAGDVVLVQSDATPMMQLGNFVTWEDALEILTDSFLEVLGPSGTLIVPTFNWDFCSGKLFDYKKSPSQVGMFSNHILFNCDSVRSLNPIISFSAIGPQADSLFKDLSNSCYGENSVYQRLHRLNATLVFFNIYLRQANFVHYAEQALHVDYRFRKDFTGRLTQDGHEWQDTYDLYVRKDIRKLSTDLRRFEKRMYELDKAKEFLIGGIYPLTTAKTKDVYNVVVGMLKNDPHCLYAIDSAFEITSNMKRKQPWNKTHEVSDS